MKESGDMKLALAITVRPKRMLASECCEYVREEARRNISEFELLESSQPPPVLLKWRYPTCKAEEVVGK